MRLLNRLLDILRHEGLIGLYDRIRDPKPFWRRQLSIPPLAGPVALRGGSVSQRKQVADSLDAFGIAISTPDTGETAAIWIDPSPEDGEKPGPQDVMVLLQTQPADLAALTPSARRCKAVLCGTVKIMAALQQAGLPPERIFFVPGSDRLDEGVTRYLVAAQGRAAGFQDWSAFAELRDLPDVPRICLGLPETTARRASFLSRGLTGFRIFDGIRFQPGWIGAAASFRIMARACLDQGCTEAVLCEDDVAITPVFPQRLAVVSDYLKDRDWDVFSGLMTDIGPDYVISKVVEYQGETFVHLNRCVGMVFGIYRPRALERLAGWSVTTGQTIDRHLEQAEGMEVVTTLPFLAGHDDGLTSSIWHFRNRRYHNMIRRSEARLAAMAKRHLAARDRAAP